MMMEKHLRRAGILVSLGLFIQLVTLLPRHPLAFIGFTAVAIPLTGAGIIYFLLSLVRHEATEIGQSGQKPRPD